MSANTQSPKGHSADDNTAEPEAGPVQDQSQDAAPVVPQQKRKASSPTPADEATSNSPKRARTDIEDPNHRHEVPQSTTAEAGRDRREMARQEEKKRGRRLLGGLMNTLSQAGAGPQHKRRQEIERRQQAKSSSQRVEDDRIRMQRLAKLEAVRKAEQLKFEEKTMKTKHADMLAKARYLRTRAKPPIYYLPWELTKSQEDLIQVQVQEAKQIIEKEAAKLAGHKEREKGEATSGITVKPPISKTEETTVEPDTKIPTNKSESTNNRPHSRGTNKAGPDRDHDRAEDVMIEEAEDTVIY
ncbi:hypothetical protein GGS20DRAFT_583152 [Poronia punctata]|nr:hypothetical protein GGS20DRAFT_583152 [Poronia punctata]